MADRALAVELHDTYCAAGDWPHAVECVAFEGYEVAANPLLTVLAGRGYARRADVPEVQAEITSRDLAAQLAADWRRSADEDERYLKKAHASEIHDVYASIRINREHADAITALLNGGAK